MVCFVHVTAFAHFSVLRKGSLLFVQSFCLYVFCFVFVGVVFCASVCVGSPNLNQVNNSIIAVVPQKSFIWVVRVRNVTVNIYVSVYSMLMF